MFCHIKGLCQTVGPPQHRLSRRVLLSLFPNRSWVQTSCITWWWRPASIRSWRPSEKSFTTVWWRPETWTVSSPHVRWTVSFPQLVFPPWTWKKLTLVRWCFIQTKPRCVSVFPSWLKVVRNPNVGRRHPAARLWGCYYHNRMSFLL